LLSEAHRAHRKIAEARKTLLFRPLTLSGERPDSRRERHQAAERAALGVPAGAK
jgi:hypothetical protein